MISRRIERVNAELKKEISSIIIFKLKNNIVNDNMISVLEVSTSADLSVAKVFVSVFPKENNEKVLNALKVCVPFIRKELARELNLRIVPTIHFLIDNNNEKVERLEQLFQQIKKED